MPRGALAWLDGGLVPAAELAARAGPGVFETLRADAHALFFVDAHLARLECGARLVGLPWPPPWDARRALGELVPTLAQAELALRLEWRPPHLTLTARVRERLPDEPALLVGAASEPLRPLGAKTVERAAYAALRTAARARGAFEALVHTAAGELVEGSVSNLFLARAGELATPPLTCGALPGIVRAALLTELEQAPLRDGAGRPWRVRSVPLGLADLASAEEVLLTNSLLGVLGVRRIVGLGSGARELPGRGGLLARTLAERFAALEAASAEPRFRELGPG